MRPVVRPGRMITRMVIAARRVMGIRMRPDVAVRNSRRPVPMAAVTGMMAGKSPVLFDALVRRRFRPDRGGHGQGQHCRQQAG